jgi:UDP-N-acetylglucosamine transferase subunit ALG13
MKIFVVVGTLHPFDRLIKTIDNWAANKKDLEITCQIGEGGFIPKSIKYFESLYAKDFNACFSESDLIIGHAGMGVVLKSLVENKPILIMPRKLELMEHATDHQMATARALAKMDYVNIAWNEDELLGFLNKFQEILPKHKISEYASGNLIKTLSEFIENN